MQRRFSAQAAADPCIASPRPARVFITRRIQSHSLGGTTMKSHQRGESLILESFSVGLPATPALVLISSMISRTFRRHRLHPKRPQLIRHYGSDRNRQVNQDRSPTFHTSGPGRSSTSSSRAQHAQEPNSERGSDEGALGKLGIWTMAECTATSLLVRKFLYIVDKSFRLWYGRRHYEVDRRQRLLHLPHREPRRRVQQRRGASHDARTRRPRTRWPAPRPEQALPAI
jgi:hypothetical protein